MLIFEPHLSGVSGDMLLAALLSLGAKEALLKRFENFKGAGIEKVKIDVENVIKKGIKSTQLKIKIVEHYHHRDIEDMFFLLEEAGKTVNASEDVLKNAKKALEIILSAEAQVHGESLDRVHLHEVGSFDTIIDVLGFFMLLEDLGEETVLSTPIRVGGGTIKTQHGLVHVPTPAVVEIARAHKIPLIGGPINDELATPTGVGILASVAKFTEFLPSIVPIRVGYGAGRKELQMPNVLRAIIAEEKSWEELVIIETSIDDATGEEMSYVVNKLQEKSLETHLIQAIGKKGRPLFILRALVKREKLDDVIDFLFKETPTIGVRFWNIERAKMARIVKQRKIKIKNSEYNLRVKFSQYKNTTKEKAEFEDLKEIAEKENTSIQELKRMLKSDRSDV